MCCVTTLSSLGSNMCVFVYIVTVFPHLLFELPQNRPTSLRQALRLQPVLHHTRGDSASHKLLFQAHRSKCMFVIPWTPICTEPTWATTLPCAGALSPLLFSFLHAVTRGGLLSSLRKAPRHPVQLTPQPCTALLEQAFPVSLCAFCALFAFLSQ